MKNLNQYSEKKPKYVIRILWIILNYTIFAILPGVAFRGFRNQMLRIFGAQIAKKSLVYSSAKIYAPWNLALGKYSVIGPNVNIYNKGFIYIGSNVVVSQGVFLCTASHDITSELMELVVKPIIVEDRVWVAAEAYIAPGIKLSKGSVIGAKACVFRDVEEYSVVGGNPAREIKKRIMN